MAADPCGQTFSRKSIGPCLGTECRLQLFVCNGINIIFGICHSLQQRQILTGNIESAKSLAINLQRMSYCGQDISNRSILLQCCNLFCEVLDS